LLRLDTSDWRVDGRVATITLNRPERKNPLTFDSYAELTATFRALAEEGSEEIRAVVLTGAGGNFCSGGDVAEIIGPLVEMAERGDRDGLLRFTTMTGDLVKSMRACPQPIVAAIDGICAGAGAILAMASDLRIGTPPAASVSCSCVSASLAPTWARARCCRGSSARAARVNCSTPADSWTAWRPSGGVSITHWPSRRRCSGARPESRRTLLPGRPCAHAVTKQSLHAEWNMSVDEAITAEAEAQALCMETGILPARIVRS
jgi:enoyl-CoA hydratase/carnithine racemase